MDFGYLQLVSFALCIDNRERNLPFTASSLLCYLYSRDVHRVKDMNFMFENAWTFSSDLSFWEMKKVEGVIGMFKGEYCGREATSSHFAFAWIFVLLGLSSHAVRIVAMYKGAANFEGSLEGWKLDKATDYTSMFESRYYNAVAFLMSCAGFGELTLLLTLFFTCRKMRDLSTVTLADGR